MKLDMDINGLIAKLTDNERRRLPQAMLYATNQAAFEVRSEWARQMPIIFDRPTALTRNAALYRKATSATNPVAEVYIRDTVAGGTAPATYLQHEAKGGQRALKPSERLLGRPYVPAPGAKLDPYGNVPAAVIRAILLAMRRQGKGKRIRIKGSKASVVGISKYFVLHQRHGKLRPGVYERVRSGFGAGIRAILYFIDQAPTYQRRFDAKGLAKAIFEARFAVLFKAQLLRLVRT